VDVADALKMSIMANGGEKLLQRFGLQMEAPSHTPGWVHLDLGMTTDLDGVGLVQRPRNIYIPY
jgi:hypothetical protein